MGIAIDISQPFRLLAKLAATFPFREDIETLTFYMLPARELASPQAMTEGCAP